MMLKLSVNNLAFRWAEEQKNLFGPIDLSFPEGQVTGLLGANGTGKSTLLNVIASRLMPTQGEISIGDRPGRASDFNYMLQHPDRLLFKHLTIEQNLKLTRCKSCYQELVDEKIRVFLPDQAPLSRYPWQCSVGQRQRAVLLRTVLDISSFPVTLLDEPFASISRESKPDIYEFLRGVVAAESRVLVFVTHDLSEACIVADRLVVLCDGKYHTYDVSAIQDEKTFLSAATLRKQIQMSLLTVSIAKDSEGGSIG